MPLPTPIKLGLSMRYLGYHAAGLAPSGRRPERRVQAQPLRARRANGGGGEARHGVPGRRHRHPRQGRAAGRAVPLGAERRAGAASPCCPRWPRSPAASAWSPPRPPPTTSRSTSPANTPRSTTSAAAGPAGTSSPPGRTPRRATSTATPTSTTRPATSGRPSSWRWSRGCGIAGKATPWCTTRRPACSSMRPSCMRSITGASTSRCAGRSASSARRRAGR